MIKYTDSFGNETEITVLPVKFNNMVHFAVNSKYRFIAAWDIITAKQILESLQKAIIELKGN